MEKKRRRGVTAAKVDGDRATNVLVPMLVQGPEWQTTVYLRAVVEVFAVALRVLVGVNLPERANAGGRELKLAFTSSHDSN